MQPAPPSDLPGPPGPHLWTSGAPARTVAPPKRKSRLPGWQLRRRVGLVLGEPPLGDPLPVPCSAPLLLLCPLHSCIASVRSQLSGPDVFSDTSFSGSLLFTLASHHSPIRMCVCILGVVVHPSHHLTRLSFTYCICALAGCWIFICDLHGYLLIHPSFIQVYLPTLRPVIHLPRCPRHRRLAASECLALGLFALRPAGDALMPCMVAPQL